MKLKIAIDLDGVLYEWEKTARYMLREIRGCAGLRQESEYWDWIQERVEKDDWNWLWRHGPDLGLWRHGHVVTGAILAVRELKAAKHRLSIVTARPEGAVKDTYAWINFHFGAERPYPWSDIRVLSGEAKSSFPADILIDDKPDNIEEWLAADKRGAILFDRTWNVEFPLPRGADRAVGWRHALTIIERMARCS